MNDLTADAAPIACHGPTKVDRNGCDLSSLTANAATRRWPGRSTRTSIKRDGTNLDYRAQNLPWATFPSQAGKVYRAGTEVGGRRCPRCPTYISVRSMSLVK